MSEILSLFLKPGRGSANPGPPGRQPLRLLGVVRDSGFGFIFCPLQAFGNREKSPLPLNLSLLDRVQLHRMLLNARQLDFAGHKVARYFTK